MTQIIYNKNGTIKDFSDEGLEARKIESSIDIQLSLEKLSTRQSSVIKLKLAGFRGKEIAKKLGVSIYTIYWHTRWAKKNLLKNMGV